MEWRAGEMIMSLNFYNIDISFFFDKTRLFYRMIIYDVNYDLR